MAEEAVHAHEIEWNDAQVSRLWDYYARTPPYSDLYFAKHFGHLLLRESGLPLGEPLEILDFGSGPGFMWDHLRRMDARCGYSALDFSPASVAALQERSKGHPLFRGATHVTSLPAPLPAAAQDAVLLIEVVEHLKDAHLDATLREASRLLKPGGVLVISTPNEEDLAASRKFCPSCGAIFHEWQHVRSWSLGALEHCVGGYGFTLVRHLATDFQARAGGLDAAVIGARRVLRRLLGRPPRNPHMLAVFQKRGS